MSDKTPPPPPLFPGRVPLLGQPEPIPYTIGGYSLAFSATPDEIGTQMQAASQQGWQPDIGFVMMWQRAAIELSAHEVLLHEALDRIAVLEKHAGIESPEPTAGIDFAAFGAGEEPTDDAS